MWIESNNARDGALSGFFSYGSSNMHLTGSGSSEASNLGCSRTPEHVHWITRENPLNVSSLALLDSIHVQC